MALVHRLVRQQGWRADLLSCLFGALAALALPPLHLLPVLLVSVPLLILMIEASRHWRDALRRGFAFGFGLHTAGLYWITYAILVRADSFWWLVPFAAPLAAIPLALFTALPCVALRLVPARPAPARRRLAAVLVFSGVWTLSDLARGVMFTGFPWNLWGSVWTVSGRFGDVMIQPAALIGVHGLTLATVLLTTLPLFGWRALLPALPVLALWAGFGVWRLDHAPQAGTAVPDAPEVVLVQGNVAETDKLDRARMVATFRNDLLLTRQGVARAGAEAGQRRPVVVVWPETAFPGLLAEDVEARHLIAEAARGASAMLIGSVRFDDGGRPRNSLFALNPQGDVVAVYDKAHLVPFGEYQPPMLPIQVVPGGGFAAGPGLRSLHLPGLPTVGPLICYEVIFPGRVVARGDRPGWLVNVTNDAWFGDSAGPRQHLAAARLRAVEEGLPLARAANTGISAVFDAYGRETARLGWGRPGTIEAPLGRKLPPTLFARIGNTLPLFWAIALLLLGIAVSGRGGRLRLRHDEQI